ncbi:MAG: hypothetical protein Q8P35_01880 [Candidatus Yanofskybacteria bacterium]|nr:hypothetical protein [Candidatus Yanofskybacteria bacterium]
MDNLSPKEQYDLKRQEKISGGKERSRSRLLGRGIKIAVALAIIGAGGFWLANYAKTLPAPDPLAICIQHQNLAMHIHPQLSVVIKGEKQVIPAEVGISAVCMRPLHTHDDTGTIHVEFPRQYSATVGDFFKIWEKQFNNTCIFDRCNGSEGTVKMLVNGAENTEFEHYVMKDLDNIEIRYE